MKLTSAIEEWQSLLGLDYVEVFEQKLADVSIATFSTTQKILAILNPSNVPEVQACIKIANKWKIPLYPISGGKNWGYGSQVSVSSESVLINLKRMNQITDYNEELAFVTIEPGVTQSQLYTFLVEQGGKLWMDATGSSPESSVLGNIVERGFGHTPYGNHFANSCGLEVVLPTGDVICTGFGRFPTSKASSIYKCGIGPSIDGLFSQSNFGIVTKLSVWLMPAPESFKAFFFSISENKNLGMLVDTLRPLKLSGVLQSSIHLGNSYKVLSAIRQYPWLETDGKTPLPNNILNEYMNIYNFGAWSGSGGIYGSKGHVKETIKIIRNSMKKKVNNLKFIDDTTLSYAERFAAPYGYFTGLDINEVLRVLRPVYNLMKGIPTSTQLGSIYWRKKTEIPENPEPNKDGVGLIWCAPIAPLTGDDAMAMSCIAEQILLHFNFEPSISMTLLNERTLSCIISVSYDRNLDGEDKRAMVAYNELLNQLMNTGYYPYRAGIQSMQKVWNESQNSYNTLLHQIKTAIDPNGILAPQRYVNET